MRYARDQLDTHLWIIKDIKKIKAVPPIYDKIILLTRICNKEQRR